MVKPTIVYMQNEFIEINILSELKAQRVENYTTCLLLFTVPEIEDREIE
jgi:hypothetical protein